MKRVSTLLVLIVFVSILSVFAQPEKPVAIVGAGGIGTREKATIIKMVLVPNSISHEDAGTYLEPREFEKYSMVIFANEVAEEGRDDLSWGDEEIQMVDAYLKGGGNLLFIGSSTFTRISGDTSSTPDISRLDFMGAERAMVWRRDPIEGKIFERKTPYTEHLKEETYEWSHLSGSISGLNDGQVLIGSTDAQHALLYVNEVGAGNVFYLGTRLHTVVSQHGEDLEPYAELIKRMVMSSNPATDELEAFKNFDIREGTLEFWFRPEWSSVYDRTWRYLIDGGPWQVYLHKYSEPSVSFLVEGEGGGRDNVQSHAGVSLEAGRWTHFAFQWFTDGDTFQVETYVDGKFQGFGYDIASGLDYHGSKSNYWRPGEITENIVIGGHSSKAAHSAEGSFAMLRISNLRRHSSDFVPDRRKQLMPDSNTLMLFNFDGNTTGFNGALSETLEAEIIDR